MMNCSRAVGSAACEDDYLSDASSKASAIFSDCESETASDSEFEVESGDSDDDSVFDDFDTDEGQLPPEHYLAEAEALDVSQLRQKRYSDSTQDKLDETVDYWNRYVRPYSKQFSDLSMPTLQILRACLSRSCNAVEVSV